MKSTADLAMVLALVAGAASAEPVQIVVQAQAETAGTRGDTDDPAIWVNPADPAGSLILGSDKSQGLFVYDLTGAERAFFADGQLNNVDLRPFTLNGAPVTLAGASKRDDDTLVFYIIDAGRVRHAEPFAHSAIPPEMPGVNNIYGFTMAQDAAGTYAVVNFKSGHVLQYLVTETAGRIALSLVRHWQVATQPEGMTADDRMGHLYVAEEDAGIWRFALSPGAPTDAFAIDMIPSDCLPEDDVEGLAIYDGADARYLIASAQGIHRAAIYKLDADAKPACQALVEVAAGAIDGVTETDGLDVTALPLGPAFPQGALLMMDDQNAGYTINFKVMNWADIAARLP